jgi:hypothetical protein
MEFKMLKVEVSVISFGMVGFSPCRDRRYQTYFAIYLLCMNRPQSSLCVDIHCRAGDVGIEPEVII